VKGPWSTWYLPLNAPLLDGDQGIGILNNANGLLLPARILHISQRSPSARLKQLRQSRILFLTSRMLSASFRASSSVARRMNVASRVAVFSPTPGSLVSSAISRLMGSAVTRHENPFTSNRESGDRRKF